MLINKDLHGHPMNRKDRTIHCVGGLTNHSWRSSMHPACGRERRVHRFAHSARAPSSPRLGDSDHNTQSNLKDHTMLEHSPQGTVGGIIEAAPRQHTYIYIYICIHT